MSEEAILSETRKLLDEKAAFRPEAQDTGDRLVQQCANDLGRYFNYGVTRVSRTYKQRSRIWQKALEVRRENPNFTPQQICDSITDIAGCRLLVIGVQDMHSTENHFCTQISSLSEVNLLDYRREDIETARDGGFRGIARIIMLTSGRLHNFPYEVQIMTHLQHTWDQLQHPLYEEARKKGGNLESTVKAKFEELSEKLYILDCDLSDTQREIFS